jgi:hypothetical protein
MPPTKTATTMAADTSIMRLGRSEGHMRLHIRWMLGVREILWKCPFPLRHPLKNRFHRDALPVRVPSQFTSIPTECRSSKFGQQVVSFSARFGEPLLEKFVE